MIPTADVLLTLLAHYGYVLLFFASFIEGPITSVLGGFLAAQGVFNPYVVFGIVFLGDIAGDITYYLIGYLGTLHPKWFKLFRLDEGQVVRFRDRLFQNLGKTILVAKYTQTGVVALTIAGALRMPFASFVWYNALSSLPKTFALVLVGYFFGYAYASIDASLRLYSIAAAALVFVGIGIFFAVHKSRKTP